MIVPKPGRTRIQGQVTCSPELVFITTKNSIFHVRLFLVYTVISIWKVFPLPYSIFVSLFPSKFGFQGPSFSDNHAILIFLTFHIPLLSAWPWSFVLYPGHGCSITEPWIFICKCLSFPLFSAFDDFYAHKLLSLVCVQYLSEKWLIFCGVLLRLICPLAHTWWEGLGKVKPLYIISYL